MENVIRGYKVADSNGKCRGYQFEVGKRYKHDGNIKICESGFHFCIKASHCFNYYSFSPNNKVFEVIGYGEYQTKDDDSKVCVGDIEIVRELTWQEVLVVSNEGRNNTGHSNSGHYNSGYYNSGDSNSGNSNSGYYNSGNRNSGIFNSNTPPLRMFNRESTWTWDYYYRTRINYLIHSITPCIWVDSNNMTEDEKKHNPNYEVVGGYLKKISLKESWVNLWNTLSKDDKEEFYKLPNFDWDIFTEITSIEKD